jgi:tetratricopeptide (TPR) repeat protein
MKVIAMFPWFVPGLTEKATLLASMSEWDQALDTAQRALDMDSDNVDALKVVAIHSFLMEAHPGDSCRKLQDFDAALQRREPSSAALLLDGARLFSRICHRLPQALEICRNMLDRAVRIKSNDGEIIVELAHVQVLQRQHASALRTYRDASKRRPNDPQVLEGTVFCQLVAGDVEDAEAQIELLEMMQSSPEETSAEFYYLKALMALRQIKAAKSDSSAGMDKHLDLMQNCYYNFFKRYEDATQGSLEPLRELVALDIDFLMQVRALRVTLAVIFALCC